tara:strand:+ start:801 stop:1106 length:306 start_codon:yes stop_codon:yes gene_type:complete
MAKHFNISGELTQELLSAGDNTKISKISFVNTQGTYSCTVDLYIEKKLTGKFYLLKGVELPVGATFTYNNMVFSNAAGEFGLYVKLNKSAAETPTVDIILQ